MVPKTQIRSMTDEDEQPRSSVRTEAKVRTMGLAGRELAAQVGWLPGASSSTFSVRSRKLAATFKEIFAKRR